MPVPLTPPYLQFFDATGAPLSYGKVYTYEATSSTNKVTYEDVDGNTVAPNPIQLNASGIPETGNGMIFIQGAYRIVVKDQYGNTVDDQPNVTSFTNTIASASPFFESLSGNGSQTSYTLSTALGTDSKGLMIFVAEPKAGFFQKFSGTGAQTVFTLSTAKGTDSSSLLVFVYNAAAADKLGFEPVVPTAYTINGTTLTFSVAPVNGTDNIYVMQPTQQSTSGIAGYIDPSLYTINGTALTFVTAPVAGTNNIKVTAPSTLAGAAAVSAAAADASATAAANSALAASASAMNAAAFAVSKIIWQYSTTTTMAAPGAGFIRLNNATLSSVTQIAISELSSFAGNPNLASFIASWDDAPANPRGALYLFKDGQNFRIYTITGINVLNTGWQQITVSYLDGVGTFANNDTLSIGFQAYGSTTVIGGITAGTGDVTFSGSGSVATTIANGVVTKAKTSTQVQGLLNTVNLAQGRITLTTGVPITTTDVTAATTLYYTPFRGNHIGLYNGTDWDSNLFSELSIAVPAVANRVYDVFIYNNAGTITIDLNAWTNDTTRAIALSLQDGVLVRSDIPQRRYVGTIRTTSVAGQTEDSKLRRLVWNYYNNTQRNLSVIDATNSWNYTTATWRQANANAANQVDCVIGLSEYITEFTVTGMASNTGGDPLVASGIGINSTSANSATLIGGSAFNAAGTGIPVQTLGLYKGYLAPGYNFIAWLEISQATGTTTWFGDNNSTFQQAGMIGQVIA